MKKNIKIFFSLLLCLSILFSAGCSIKSEKEETPEDETTQYSEETEPVFEEETQSETVSQTQEETQSQNLDSTKAPSKRPQRKPEPATVIVTVPATVPAPVKKDVDSFKWNSEGVYEVGTGKNMLVPGEYYIVKTGSKESSVNLVNERIARRVDNSYLVNLKSGDKVYLIGCKIINTQSAHPHAQSNGKYTNGIYKVGRDIPQGEYILRQQGSYGRYDVFPALKLSGNFDDLKGRVKNFKYITLKNGSYLYLDRCTLEPISNKPIYDRGSSENYVTGMYKVGKDLPAGSYKIRSANSGYASYEILADSNFPSPAYIKKETEVRNIIPTSVELKDGQYIFIDNAIMTPAPANS